MDVATILVADLVDSRLAPDRDRLADQVEVALDSLHQRWNAEWLARPVTTRGLDEISGVLRRPRHAFDASVALNEAVWPRRFRAAIASGPIDVAARSGDASAMDGPAFHRAADALQRAEASGLPCAFDLEELDRPGQDLLEALARLHASAMAQWKPSRFRAVTAMRQAPTQQAVAAALGVTQQSVSEALRAGQFAELVAAEDALRGFLSRLAPGIRSPGGADS